LVGRYFEVRTARPRDPDHTRTLLERWYREKAYRILRERFERGVALMTAYGVGCPPLGIRKMERRWGSCTPDGRVLLNPRLVLAPTASIDYVVVHELCHLLHPHHGRPFYDLLARVMPDWEDRKTRLERVQ
jgi:predicted metal-dependent hydrolase